MNRTQAKETPLVIRVGQQGDGAVYGLDYHSEQRIRARYPEAHVAKHLFVGYEGKQDIKRLHGPFWREIAKILTGLTDEQIEQLGGLLVFDPERKRSLWRWTPGHAAT
jgi:hypothetical protein